MALTQADLAKLNAQHEAVQKELFDIVTKRGVSAEQREIDNARINVLNKRAADIVKQQRSAQGIVDDTPSKPAPKPRDTSTATQNISPAETDNLNALQAKKAELQRKATALINAQKQGQPPNPEIRKLQNQATAIEEQQNKIIAKGSKPPGEPLLNQQGANVGEPSQISENNRQADALLAGAGGREGRVPGGGFGMAEPDTSRGSPDVIPDRRSLPDGPVLPNELHQYPSYTYGISLHLLTDQEYNEIVSKQNFKPTRVLISSAGRHDTNTFPRSPFFNEDFYFDDLEIDTVIVPNAVTSNTNAIKLAFTIIEPYGFSLIDRLIEAAKDLKLGTYLGMPYLLEIDFFAHNDAGEIVGKLSNISKRIPIRLLTMDVQASAKGTEYRITASPFGHSAFDATTITVPDHMEIVAGSIGEFFGTNNAEIDQAADRDDATREVPNSPFGTTESIGPAAPKVNNKYQRHKSLSDALNAYYLDLKIKNLALTNDRYYFKFDKEILENQGFASIDLGLVKAKNMKMASSKDANSIRVSNVPNGASSDAFDLKTKAFAINTGTTIEKVITQVVCMSNYIQNQLAVPEDFNGDIVKFKAKLAEIKDKPLGWFRIVPIVTLREWDSRKQAWQRDITYHVQTYQIKNVKMDIAPQQAATSPIKRYDYLYTGKNNDIIDWDLKFNLLYYNAVTVHKNAAAYLSNYGTSHSENSFGSLEETKRIGITQSSKKNDYNLVMPIAYKNIISNDQTLAGTDETTARAMAISDLRQSVTIQEGADMMQVKLKIIGDPAYIKQDDVFYPPTAFDIVDEPDQITDQRLTANGSLRTDYGQLNVRLTFQQPRDIEEDKSLTFSEPSTSLFSGLFLLVSVVSNFSQGVFTQVLNLVRLIDQPDFDSANPTPEASIERVADETATGTEETSTVTDEPSALPPPSADPDEGSKAAEVPAEEADPRVDPNQEDLANINATAPTQTIDSATAPQTTVPLQERISFNEAFRRARAANGGQPGGVFKWNDALYQTNIVGEEYVQNPTPVTYNTTPGNS